jgi:hypothetical protein
VLDKARQEDFDVTLDVPCSGGGLWRRDPRAQATGQALGRARHPPAAARRPRARLPLLPTPPTSLPSCRRAPGRAGNSALLFVTSSNGEGHRFEQTSVTLPFDWGCAAAKCGGGKSSSGSSSGGGNNGGNKAPTPAPRTLTGAASG